MGLFHAQNAFSHNQKKRHESINLAEAAHCLPEQHRRHLQHDRRTGHGPIQPKTELTNRQTAAETPAEWKSVEAAIGRKGAMQPGDVFKFGLPRTDLQVTANGVQIQPTFALGS